MSTLTTRVLRLIEVLNGAAQNLATVTALVPEDLEVDDIRSKAVTVTAILLALNHEAPDLFGVDVIERDVQSNLAQLHRDGLVEIKDIADIMRE